jgi:hypothetical protein
VKGNTALAVTSQQPLFSPLAFCEEAKTGVMSKPTVGYQLQRECMVFLPLYLTHHGMIFITLMLILVWLASYLK